MGRLLNDNVIFKKVHSTIFPGFIELRNGLHIMQSGGVVAGPLPCLLPGPWVKPTCIQHPVVLTNTTPTLVIKCLED